MDQTGDIPKTEAEGQSEVVAASDPAQDYSLPDEEKRKRWLIGGGIVLLVLLILLGVIISRRGREQLTPITRTSPTPTPTPVVLQASNLDGVAVPVDRAIRHPLAIMVENHPEARPQSGLGEASILYEAVTEGGITRFLAVYGHSLPPKVGPVRSARTYYIDWAEEYTPKSAYYAFIGGAANALEKIAADKIYELNQFSIGSRGYERIPKAGVASVHTLFAFPDKLYQIAQERGYRSESDFQSWKFKSDGDLVNRPEAQTITIPFSNPSFTVKYVYDKVTNSYKRYMGNDEQKDDNTGKQLVAKNVVVQFATYQTVKSAGKDVQKVGVIGEGKAIAFRDGRALDGKWKKTSSTGRTIFSDAATGAEIEFNRGAIFIAVPKVGTVITVQ